MRLGRRAALLFAVGLVIAFGGLASGHGATAERDATAPGVATFIAQHDGLGAAAAALEREQRRESVTSPRGSKHPLTLVAVLATSLAIVGPWARRAENLLVPPTLTSRWSRSRGRAPPPLQLSVV